MKLIIAIIQPSKLESVKAALTEVEVVRLTVMDCQGFGRQKGHTELYRGHEITVNLLRKVQLQIAVNQRSGLQKLKRPARAGESEEHDQLLRETEDLLAVKLVKLDEEQDACAGLDDDGRSQ